MPVPVNGSRTCTPASLSERPEFLFQYVIGALEDEVDDFDRRVDDAESVGLLLQRGREELLVQLHQDVLAGRTVVETPGSQPHALVESLKVAGLVLEPELTEVAAQHVKRFGHRIGPGEVIPLEQSLEDWARQDVLRHHFDGAVARDRIVDRDLQLLVKPVEPLTVRRVLRVGK